MSRHSPRRPAPTRILTGGDVRRLLPMDRCIELVADALTALARGEALNPLRAALWQPDRRGLLGLMPGFLGAAGLGVKVVGVFPGNHALGLDSHQGFVALFDAEHGAPRAIVDAASITAIRTAATSGLATRLLARPASRCLALLGTGVQARSHLEAMTAVLRLDDVRVWSRSPAHRLDFVEWAGRALGVPVAAAGSAREAVEGADVVCTTTASPQPVLLGDWLAPGLHVNAVGSSMRSSRELDGVAMARSLLFVDRRESAVNEAGDYLLALEEGAIGPDHIRAELGELLLGSAAGRTSEEEITVFESLGLAVEDLAAAAWVLERAREQDAGVEVELA
ncbi:MAG TPA: ornithine cyclodeaminase family protein [Thermoanaerobaculia bacterium]|nr:ornithine cyclodeaminase family protein [Thermoanaerobaculia bacterium]